MCRVVEEYAEKSYEKVRLEAKKETAINMINDGLSNQKIAQYVELPLEIIENFREELLVESK